MAGKLKGVDLRQHGSGNLGATNVVRVLGAKIGAAVFVVDVLKGFLPVFFLPRYTDTLQPNLWALAFGVAAILGHVKPVFLLWRGGGKGVATAAGVFAALAPIPSLITFGVWVTVFFVTRYVSLASIIGAIALPTAIWYFNNGTPQAVFDASILIAAFVVWTHRANIGRLRRGEEHRFVKKQVQS
ncbi:MAG: glycerol-3-phosphate 1-O-acyltransferase PlsY [Gemmatimonadota bacterium]|nr:glycerol-3-phosphate 1-O-acyltransferase PlsY [Gemmatimonadota bacterium]